MTRREWLWTAASGAMAAGRYAPLLGAQLYVWTQQFQKEHRTIAEGVADALGATRRAGYTRVELMKPFFDGDLRTRTPELLRGLGLEMPICYHGGPMHEPAGADKTIGEVMELAGVIKPVGARAISFNSNPIGRPKSDEELSVQAGNLNRLGEKLRGRGMRLFVHQHAPEMADHAREWRYDLQHTDPKLVSLCLDVHWVLRGGQDPMTLLREAGRRVASLHLRNSRQGVWMEELGDGDIDYRQVAAYLKQIGYQGYLLVELAYEKETPITRSLEEDLRRSRGYAERVFT